MNPINDVLPPRIIKPSIFLPSLMIILGLLAILLPVAASIGIARLIGWLILFDGVVQIFHAFRSTGIGHVTWKLLIATLYLLTAVYLLAHPILALAVLTLVLSVFFFIQGMVDIIAYFFTRRTSGSPWMLLSGAVTSVLAVIIWRHWLSSSLWLVGTFVGISMILAGTTRLMMALTTRRMLRESTGETLLHDRAA